jgi:hypothetical protein
VLIPLGEFALEWRSIVAPFDDLEDDPLAKLIHGGPLIKLSF